MIQVNIKSLLSLKIVATEYVINLITFIVDLATIIGYSIQPKYKLIIFKDSFSITDFISSMQSHDSR